MEAINERPMTQEEYEYLLNQITYYKMKHKLEKKDVYKKKLDKLEKKLKEIEE